MDREAAARLRDVAHRIGEDEDFAMSVGEDPRAALGQAGLADSEIAVLLPPPEVTGFGTVPDGDVSDADRQALVEAIERKARELSGG